MKVRTWGETQKVTIQHAEYQCDFCGKTSTHQFVIENCEKECEKLKKENCVCPSGYKYLYDEMGIHKWQVAPDKFIDSAYYRTREGQIPIQKTMEKLFDLLKGTEYQVNKLC